MNCRGSILLSSNSWSRLLSIDEMHELVEQTCFVCVFVCEGRRTKINKRAQLCSNMGIPCKCVSRNSCTHTYAASLCTFAPFIQTTHPVPRTALTRPPSRSSYSSLDWRKWILFLHRSWSFQCTFHLINRRKILCVFACCCTLFRSGSVRREKVVDKRFQICGSVCV